MGKWGAALVAVGLIALATGCGSSGETTTVVKERTVQAPPPTQESVTSEPPSRPKPKPKPKAPPNVVDLPLDVAEELLEEAGYRVAATNTDTTFGIVVPENFTVCTQDEPRGKIVPVLAQKYGC